MGAAVPWVVSLAEAEAFGDPQVGGKGRNLSRLEKAGFRIPSGFCVTVRAYRQFIKQNRLGPAIRFELGRKSLDHMRWEELWDAALRIRSSFLRCPVPETVALAIHRELDNFARGTRFVVRSSAPGEDSKRLSFAGLHESVVGVTQDQVLESVKRVWASLWSDAALLYRKELGLSVARARMGVVIQEFIEADCSGVAFSRDPRSPQAERAIIEVVPGACQHLVDGLVEPDQWILDWRSGTVQERRRGKRESGKSPELDLQPEDIASLWRTLKDIETLLAQPVDIEWTGLQTQFTVLQARPISNIHTSTEDLRPWYLSLRLEPGRLKRLCTKVVEELIPQLETLGKRLAATQLSELDDSMLVKELRLRLEAVTQWRRIYRDDFIPFADGVRQLGLYYNQAVKPKDTFEFIGLLHDKDRRAHQRNRSLQDLATRLRKDPELKTAMRALRDAADPESELQRASRLPGGAAFLELFRRITDEYFDVSFADERLADHPEWLAATLIELSEMPDTDLTAAATSSGLPTRDELEKRLLRAVGTEKAVEAQEVMRIGRLSWRMRDDDNLLLGRIEGELLRALDVAAHRLRAGGRLSSSPQVPVHEQHVSAILAALEDANAKAIHLASVTTSHDLPQVERNQSKPRQLVGQPAAPGCTTGRVRTVRCAADIGAFRHGEVLVCRAIEPTMTQLVPLACAIIECRGGMLIHGAIIARELGIPCVNGIYDAMEQLEDHEQVTVDGYLGIVSIGEPDFRAEGVSTD